MHNCNKLYFLLFLGIPLCAMEKGEASTPKSNRRYKVVADDVLSITSLEALLQEQNDDLFTKKIFFGDDAFESASDSEYIIPGRCTTPEIKEIEVHTYSLEDIERLLTTGNSSSEGSDESPPLGSVKKIDTSKLSTRVCTEDDAKKIAKDIWETSSLKNEKAAWIYDVKDDLRQEVRSLPASPKRKKRARYVKVIRAVSSEEIDETLKKDPKTKTLVRAVKTHFLKERKRANRYEKKYKKRHCKFLCG